MHAVEICRSASHKMLHTSCSTPYAYDMRVNSEVIRYRNTNFCSKGEKYTTTAAKPLIYYVYEQRTILG